MYFLGFPLFTQAPAKAINCSNSKSDSVTLHLLVAWSACGMLLVNTWHPSDIRFPARHWCQEEGEVRTWIRNSYMSLQTRVRGPSQIWGWMADSLLWKPLMLVTNICYWELKLTTASVSPQCTVSVRQHRACWVGGDSLLHSVKLTFYPRVCFLWESYAYPPGRLGLTVSLLCLLHGVGSAPTSVKGTSVGRFDVMSMFAEAGSDWLV